MMCSQCEVLRDLPTLDAAIAAARAAVDARNSDRARRTLAGLVQRRHRAVHHGACRP